MMLLLAVALVGVAISAYGLYIEKQLQTNPSYKPACDLNDRISCSKPLLSSYGSLWGISNSYWGIAYYIIVIVLTASKQYSLLNTAVFIGVVMSVYFAYLLAKLKTACLLCISIYLINILLAVLVFWHYV